MGPSPEAILRLSPGEIGSSWLQRAKFATTVLHPLDGDLVGDIALRATRAELLVQLGELSSAREALEGAALAPGTNDPLNVDRRKQEASQTP